MGTFAGHALPGSFLFILGAWWTFGAWRVYVRSRARKRPYIGRAWYVLPCASCGCCFEGAVKIACCAIGIAGEVATGFKGGRFVHMGNTQHVSMYLFYLFSGLVDVLTNCRFPFPTDTDYVGLLLAVTVEGLLFHFHLHGRAHLDVLIHTILVYVIAAEAACVIVEMCRKHSSLAALGRGYCGMLQGTWFWQVGFMLYSPLQGSPTWDVHSHDDMMLAASVFTWHMLASLLLTGLLGFVAWAVCSRCDCDDPSVDTEEARYALVSGSTVASGREYGSGDKAANRTLTDGSDDESFG